MSGLAVMTGLAGAESSVFVSWLFRNERQQGQDRFLRLQDGFIRPGTDVDTVLFLKEPARHSGQVRWTLAEPREDKIVYRMGIWLPLDEPVS